MCCSVLLTLMGCTKEKETNKVQQENEVVQDENEVEKEPEEENTKKVMVNIYKINPDNEERIVEVKECEELNEKVLWKFLKEVKVVPKESFVLSLEINGSRLELDVDNAFGEWLRSLGTTGEQEIISCVVNTYLDAYKAEQIKITEVGQVLCSGHAEYAEYLKKFE